HASLAQHRRLPLDVVDEKRRHMLIGPFAGRLVDDEIRTRTAPEELRTRKIDEDRLEAERFPVEVLRALEVADGNSRNRAPTTQHGSPPGYSGALTLGPRISGHVQ